MPGLGMPYHSLLKRLSHRPDRQYDRRRLGLPPRATRFSRYLCKASGLSLASVIYAQNHQNYIQNGSGQPMGQSLSAYSANTMAHYRLFLIELLKREYLFRTMEQLLISKHPPIGKAAVLRHDIDGDLPAALRCAQIENDLNIKSTYYILHTAPYYGAFANGYFWRNDACITIYQEIQDLGHEIGLHADPLWIFQTWGMDGIEGLIEELAWLRSHGLRIVGTAPHNGPAAYGGLSNSEIFSGRFHSDNAVFGALRSDEVDPSKTEGIPVRALVESKLELSYEADDLWRQGWICDWVSIVDHDKIMRAIWWDPNGTAQELIFAMNGLGPFLTSLRRRFGGLSFAMSHDDVLGSLIPSVPHVLYLSVHPEFYGRRNFPMSWP